MKPENIARLEMLIDSDYGNMAGLVVRKDGEKVYENYFHGYTAESKVHVASVTKSVLSALIGIAVDGGCIQSIDRKVLEYFPHYTVPDENNTIRNISLRHLLTMNAPYKNEVEPYEAFFASDNWVQDALDFLGGEGRIGDFRYTAIVGPDILSGILMQATGRSVLEYANDNLFAPLGITARQNVVLRNKEEHIALMQEKNANYWVADSHGVHAAGWGLSLSAVEMAGIGQLYLDGGIRHGKQILSPEWIRKSTTEQSRWDAVGLSYGYLWWIINENERAYAAMGDGGNVIYVNETKNLVVAIASLFIPDAKDRIKLIREHIAPIFAKF